MKIKNVYQLALDVQDTSNLSGILLTFADMVQEIILNQRPPAGVGVSAWLSRHPAYVLYLDKINSMSNLPINYSDPSTYAAAYAACLAQCAAPGESGKAVA